MKEMKRKSMNCMCGKVAEYKEHLKFNNNDIDGWLCKNCGQTYYNPEKAETILLLNKLKKMRYKLTLGQIKSNLILRIPKDLGTALDLHKGEEMELELHETESILIHPISATERIHRDDRL